MLGSCFYFRKMGGSGGKWGIEMANWAEGLHNKFKYVVNFPKIGVSRLSLLRILRMT